MRRLIRKDAERAGDDVVIVDLGNVRVADLAGHLQGVFAVVHLAGRAHVMRERVRDVDATYKFANVDVTERVALAAVAAGVERFIFASTVKVNGESTTPGRRLRTGDAPAPQDAYARSKLAAERILAHVASGTSMITVNLRLPLVYGPGARGNFGRLVDAVASRRVLPLGAIDNRRSLLGIDNLLDALDVTLAERIAVSGTHFLADADSVSTPALVRAIAAALGVIPRLLPVPVPLLRVAGALCGRRAAIARLTESLEVDTTSFERATGWRPRRFAIDTATVSRAAP